MKKSKKTIIKKKIEINNGNKVVLGKISAGGPREKKMRQPPQVSQAPKPVAAIQQPRTVPKVNTDAPKPQIMVRQNHIENNKITEPMSLSGEQKRYLRIHDKKPKTNTSVTDERRIAELIGPLINRINRIPTSKYSRSSDFDYDVVITLSSYNRFDKLYRLLEQLYTQSTRYKFKIVLLNDASTDARYSTLGDSFPEMEYVTNLTNNGRRKYWYTVTQIWQMAKNYKTDALMMIDDDFILCDKFIEVALDAFYTLKNRNNDIVAVAPHLHSVSQTSKFEKWWYNTYSIDGIGIFDINFIKAMDYQLQPVSQEQLDAIKHAHGWSQIQRKIVEMDKIAYKLKYSIAFHDGNDLSLLGKDNPNKAKAYTHKYYSRDVLVSDLLY